MGAGLSPLASLPALGSMVNKVGGAMKDVVTPPTASETTSFLGNLLGVQAVTFYVGLILLIIGLVSLTRYKDQLVEAGHDTVKQGVVAGAAHVAKVGAAIVAA